MPVSRQSATYSDKRSNRLQLRFLGPAVNLLGCRASPPFGQYQIILLGDRGISVSTTCLQSLHDDEMVGSLTCFF